MRPLKLTMQAFGAYLNRVEIPFENLPKGAVYLISGVTGSGKTTIFDAISFALFNKSSGSIRGNSSLRSHFAQDSDESFVEFVFEFKGEKYIVTRTPSYEKKKLKKEGKVNVNSTAQIVLPDLKIISGVREVDDYIVNLLGVDSVQFNQIALLAQGEFLKLLNTDSQKRGEIFRNIFKTDKYLNFSNCIQTSEKELKNQYSDLSKSLIQYVFQIIPDNEKLKSCIDSYENNSSILNFDELILLLKSQITDDNSLISAYEEEILKLNKLISDNKISILKAEEKNSLVFQLENFKNEILKLKPELDFIEKQYKTIETKNKELSEIKISIEKQNEILNKINQYKNFKKSLQLLNKKEDELKNTLNILKNNHVELFYNYCNYLDKQYFIAKNEFVSLEKEIINKTQFYNNLNMKFLSMQAGILASELEDNMPCPVCGSCAHPNPAVLEDNISFELVEKAKGELDNLNKKLSELSINCAVLNENLLSKKSEFELTKQKYGFVDLEVKDDILDFDDKKFDSLIKKSDTEILNIENELLQCNLEKTKISSSIELLSENFDENMIDIVEEKYLALKESAKKLQDEIELVANTYSLAKQNYSDLISKQELIIEQLENYRDFNVDIDKVKKESDDINSKLDVKNAKLKTISFRKNTNSNLLKAILSVYEKYQKTENKYLHYKILSDCACGNLKGRPKIAFEQYVQGYYLDLILHEANKHLKIMTKNQFMLFRKKSADSLNSKTGLDIEVMDFHTFKTRSTKTLSGGESFMAALSLALGLSDVVSNFSGAIGIDAMFIDEGFGTLDSESLELAMDVINSLSENNRLIGVISHVEHLKNRIENRIISVKTDYGSKVELNF